MKLQAGQQAWKSQMNGRKLLHERPFVTMSAVMIHLVPVVLLSLLFTGLTSAHPTSEAGVLHTICLLILYLAADVVVCSPIGYGLLRWLSLRGRGEMPPMTEVLCAFESGAAYLRALGAGMCMLMYRILYGIPIFVTAIMICRVFNASGAAVYEIVYLAFLVLTAITLSYDAAYVLLAEDSELTPWQAFRLCPQIWKGNQGVFIRLLLNFGFWLFLLIMSNGLFYVYVYPYLLLSVFDLFDAVRNPEQYALKEENDGV